jgi:hypothetical protein
VSFVDEAERESQSGVMARSENKTHGVTSVSAMESDLRHLLGRQRADRRGGTVRAFCRAEIGNYFFPGVR